MTRWREWSRDLDEAVLAARKVGVVNDIPPRCVGDPRKRTALKSVRGRLAEWAGRKLEFVP